MGTRWQVAPTGRQQGRWRLGHRNCSPQAFERGCQVGVPPHHLKSVSPLDRIREARGVPGRRSVVFAHVLRPVFGTFPCHGARTWNLIGTRTASANVIVRPEHRRAIGSSHWMLDGSRQFETWVIRSWKSMTLECPRRGMSTTSFGQAFSAQPATAPLARAERGLIRSGVPATALAALDRCMTHTDDSIGFGSKSARPGRAAAETDA